MTRYRGACRDCRTCRATDGAKLAYGLGVAPFMLLLHVTTMGMTYFFIKKCPVCRHRRSRHAAEMLPVQSYTVLAEETPGQPVPVAPTEQPRRHA